MAERKSFLLRLPPELFDELNRWARDELRSVNGHIEFLLRDAVRRYGRRSLPPANTESPSEPAAAGREAGPEAGAGLAGSSPRTAGSEAESGSDDAGAGDRG